MKRMLVILIAAAMLLSLGCITIVLDVPKETSEPAETAGEQPTASLTDACGTLAAELKTEKPSETPQAEQTALPMVFNAYEEMESDQTEALMFTYDLDRDGTPEEIRVSLDWENDDTTITDGTRSYTFERSAMLSHVILIDLNPKTSYANLVVCIDEASDDFITVVLHPEGDKLVAGEEHYLYCIYDWDAEELLGYERTDLLGTQDGSRLYSGETLEPLSDWLDCWYPSPEKLQTNREALIENGRLLHARIDVPCLLNDEPSVIKAGSYVYLLRYSDKRGSAELCLENGTHVDVTFARNEESWGYLIEGIPQDDCFDNIFYAD